MATRYAVANGNWSALATWDGGASLPGAGDDVYADGKTVTIDQNVNVGSIRNTQRSGGTNNGTFVISGSYTITCTGLGFQSSAVYCLTCSVAGATITLNADFNTGNTTASAAILYITGISTFNIVGNMYGAASSGYGIRCDAAATFNITGNMYGGAHITTSAALYLRAACTVNVTGNVYATTGYAIESTNASIINVVGTVTASANNPAIYSSVATTVVIVTGTLVNTLGIVAVLATKIYLSAGTTQWTFQKSDGSNRILYTADVLGGNPTEADVKAGVVFGPSSELLGTYAPVVTVADISAALNAYGAAKTSDLAAIDISAGLTAYGAAKSSEVADIPNIKTRTDKIPDFPSSVQSTGDQIKVLTS